MRFVKESRHPKPKISLVLVDWSVRESFHLLHYLSRQSVERDLFEVVVVEFYSRESEAVKQFEHEVDTWILLEMPDSCIYHKHLMYNAGLILSQGEIVAICDSDAMVRERFVEGILQRFESEGRIVLHLDQFRNVRKDFYPFNYPTFDQVLASGCINSVQGKTRGILDRIDPLHSRNYGACMCAPREDLVAIGGADEHINYLGHICGPYEMTFRLKNFGLREVWHDQEFLYHTWHPGQAGVGNYQGPHDGKQMSQTALEAIISKRVYPLVQNRLVQKMRADGRISADLLRRYLIDSERMQDWDGRRAASIVSRRRATSEKNPIDLYGGYTITRKDSRYYGNPTILGSQTLFSPEGYAYPIEAGSLSELLAKVDRGCPRVLRFWKIVNAAHGILQMAFWSAAWPCVRIGRAIFGRSHKGLIDPNGERNVSWVRPTKELLQNYRFGWSAAKEYTSFVSDSVDALVVNLYFLKKMQIRTSKSEPVFLVTTSAYVQLYFFCLRALGIVPPLKILRFKNSESVQSYLQSFTEKDGKNNLLLLRNVYFNHLGLIQAHSNLREAGSV